MFSTTFFKWLFVYLLTFSHNSVILVLRANMTGEDWRQHLGGKHGNHGRASVTCWRGFLSNTKKIKLLCNNVHPSLQFLNRDCQCAAKLHKIPLLVPLLRSARVQHLMAKRKAKRPFVFLLLLCSLNSQNQAVLIGCINFWTFLAYDEEHRYKHK